GLPDVEVNGNQIKQVFVNLINNANQAIASDARSGRIWVTAKRLREGVAVSITDSGPGMTEELAGHVFEPFFTTKGEGEGTGLGLSICQGIVKEHGGRITLDTKPGGGATFTVELPGGARAPLAEPAPAPVAAGKRLRILVVDDEPHILYYMRATLESWGHAVEVASDGAYALERAIAGDFDVIICDLRMPHLSGREMYQKLARHDPRAAEQRAGAARRGRRGSGARGPVDHGARPPGMVAAVAPRQGVPASHHPRARRPRARDRSMGRDLAQAPRCRAPPHRDAPRGIRR